MNNSYEHMRVVGKASEEAKETLRNDYAKRLGEKHFEQFSEDELQRIRETEHKKTLFEAEIIKKANDITNSVLTSIEVSTAHVGPENVHIIDSGDFEQISGDTSDVAMTSQKSRSVVLNTETVRKIALKEAVVMLHEMFHLKEFVALEIVDEKERRWGFYRSGVSTHAPEKKYQMGLDHVHFKGLSEAITAELEKRYFGSMLKTSVLKEEKERMQTEQAQKIIAEVAERENEATDDIFWVSPDGKDYEMFSYPIHRGVLNFLVKEMFKAHPDKFSSEEDVLNLFLRAQYGPGMLLLAKAFEATFGKDSFEVLSMMGLERSSAAMTLDYFRKYKRRITFKK